MGRLSGFLALGSPTNKAKQRAEEEREEGVVSPLLPELTLEIKNKDLISMKKRWEKRWDAQTGELKKMQKQNERYWLGQQFEGVVLRNNKNRPLIDNRLFSSLETFLPIATRQNPDPMVESDMSEEGMQLADKVQKMLVFQADVQRLKLKMKTTIRYSSLYHLGVAKIGWSEERDDIKTQIVRPQKMILDPTATIEEGVDYTGEYIGEVKKTAASDLVEQFPKKETFISEMVDGKMGTELQYTEWWTDDFVFWTLKDEVLKKMKNPHWNYDDTAEKTDEFGRKIPETVPGVNHFRARKMPYIFLSVFNIGKHPWDETSLFQQNISLQDLINKRMEQIDRNTDNQNNGLIVSGDHFSKEQARQAANTLARGGTIFVPSGDINTAVKRDTGNSLPSDVFNNLVDTRNEIDNIFGTHGTTRGEQGTQETARGRITLKAGDESRIGGGVSEYLEQFVDQIYNWWTQMMYVYYDEEHSATVIGTENAREHISLINDEFVNVKELTVSVKEGSLIPKDELTKRNEAVDLWSAGALSILDLYILLKVPDPKKATERWLKQQSDPTTLLQEGQEEAGQGPSPLGPTSLAQPQGPQAAPQDALAAQQQAVLGAGPAV